MSRARSATPEDRITDYDAVVVGGSIAGATTAILLARQGARVALLEKSPDPAHFKTMCTHEIAGIGRSALARLGVLDLIDEARGERDGVEFWSRYGWVRERNFEPTPDLHAVNIRRETLDPMLRELAGGTDGVDLMLGTTATALLNDEAGRPAGVTVRTREGMRDLSARIVVAADGRSSSVAKMAGIRARVKPHGRFGYFGYFENAKLRSGRGSQFWFLDPDQAYAFPTDGGLTLIALVPRTTPEALAAFKADPAGEFARRVAELPDGPDLSGATQVGKFRAIVHSPNLLRPASIPGLALVGDAAQTSDYVWGTGCGFALATAEWLADGVGPALAHGGSAAEVDRALVAYRRLHRRKLAMHHLMITDFATARPLSRPERLIYGAAPHDRAVGLVMMKLGARVDTPQRILTPKVMGRAAFVRARHRARALPA